MNLLVDMNLSPGWVAFLVQAGFTAVHWSDVGAEGATDTELMRWAAEHHHVVVTNDLDFGAILAATRRQLPSVVQIRSDVLAPAAIGSFVVKAIRQAELELGRGAIMSIDAGGRGFAFCL
jgi:predicted nuclease of predicted toxin-antitoxin system